MSNNMPNERKGEKVKPGIYRVYNGSPVEVIMMVPETVHMPDWKERKKQLDTEVVQGL